MYIDLDTVIRAASVISSIGVIIGVIEKVGGYFVGDNLAQIFIFVMFIVILIVRPDGLLAKRKKG